MVALYGYFACRPSSPLNWNEIALRRKNYQQIIEKTAQTVELESALIKALIKAVIHAESNFNPLTLPRKGARGLMQLMPATAK